MGDPSELSSEKMSYTARARIRELADSHGIDSYTIGKLMHVTDQNLGVVWPEIQTLTKFGQLYGNKPYIKDFLEVDWGLETVFSSYTHIPDERTIADLAQAEDAQTVLRDIFVVSSQSFESPWNERISKAAAQIFPNANLIKKHLIE